MARSHFDGLSVTTIISLDLSCFFWVSRQRRRKKKIPYFIQHPILIVYLKEQLVIPYFAKFFIIFRHFSVILWQSLAVCGRF
jgi:hypothetical protein